MNGINTSVRYVNDGLFPYNGDDKHQLAFLLNYAILAPSHYNAQPWKFKVSDKALDVYLDRTRVSTVVDPYAREAIISCGAAISILETAAHYFGLNIEVNLNSDVQSDHIAQIHIAGHYDPTEKDLVYFFAIKKRQTNRNWFQDAEITDDLLQESQRLIEGLNVQLAFHKDEGVNFTFSALTERAVQRQFTSPWFRLEFTSWQRSIFSLKQDGVTGFGFYHPEIPYPLARPLLRLFSWGTSIGKYNLKKCQTGSPIFAVISTKEDCKDKWINTGRALSSLLLLLTTHQLSASFMNQVIQEPYLRQQLPGIFDTCDNAQLVLRIGKAAPVHWTPRRSVEQTLI